MRGTTLALLCATLLLAGCSAYDDEPDAAAQDSPAAPSASPPPTQPPNSLGEATPVDPDGAEAASDRWSWVEDPNGVSLRDGISVLRTETDSFDFSTYQFIAEEIDLACIRLDDQSVGSVVMGEGRDLYGDDYGALVAVAAEVSCTQHTEAVYAWAG